MTTTYDYPANGNHDDTVATLDDGRQMLVSPRYASIAPLGRHADDCEQVTKMGGSCSCGMLDGIDVDTLVADAREHGKFGLAPIVLPQMPAVRVPVSLECSKCHTYCCGDCG